MTYLGTGQFGFSSNTLRPESGNTVTLLPGSGNTVSVGTYRLSASVFVVPSGTSTAIVVGDDRTVTHDSGHYAGVRLQERVRIAKDDSDATLPWNDLLQLYDSGVGAYPTIAFNKAQGTLQSPTTVAAGATIGALLWRAWSGSPADYDLAAGIRASVTETTSGATRGTRLRFSVYPSGASAGGPNVGYTHEVIRVASICSGLSGATNATGLYVRDLVAESLFTVMIGAPSSASSGFRTLMISDSGGIP